MKRSTGIKAYLDELLLYSGQFGLYYVIMQLVIQKGSFLTNFGHMGLSAVLLVQTWLLARFAGTWPRRLLFSFIVPLFYSLVEYSEGLSYLLNAAHTGFWIYAGVSSLLMIVKGRSGERTQHWVDTLSIFSNVFIFLFLYFYFDTWKDVQDNALLTALRIFAYLKPFLADPTHWYVIFGGLFLALTIALGRYEIARLKNRISALFGTYVDRSVKEEIIEKGEFTARTDAVCVLFADIISFTSLCERTDADRISRMLNVYFEYWNGIVKRRGGVVDKYIGDAIMVIFGLGGGASACDAAVACALDAMAGRDRLYAELREKGLPVIEGFGIGCHYGDVIIGDVGSLERKNFTAIGDTVNVASRIEGITRKVPSKIVISAAAFERLGAEYRSRFSLLGKVALKGKGQVTEVWGAAGDRG